MVVFRDLADIPERPGVTAREVNDQAAKSLADDRARTAQAIEEPAQRAVYPARTRTHETGPMNTPNQFHRISRLPPYVFEEVNKLKAEARARGEDIIDFGMGNPDMPTPKHIVDKLIETARDPRANRYSASRGIKGLRRAMAALLPAPLRREARSRHRGDRRRWARRKASPISPRRSPRRATWCWCPIPPIRSTPSASSWRAPRSATCRRTTPEEFLSRTDARDQAFLAVAACAGGELSVEPDGADGRTRFLQRGRRAREEARHVGALRSRLCRHLFRRRQPAALDPAGRRRQGHRHRIPVAVEDLCHAGLAHGLCGRQRDADRGAGADQILSRLRRLHADPGRGGRGAERPAGLRRRNPRHLQVAPRRAGGMHGTRRLGHSRRRPHRCSPGRRSRRHSRSSARWNSPSAC